MSQLANPIPPDGAVRIVEVGPRDGLQNEKINVPLDTKLELIRRLEQAGVSNLEVTSFVSPKWVPQMGDHAELMARLVQHPEIRYAVLTPNLKGFENAIAGGAREVAVFASASESFSERNVNCSIKESIKRFEPILLAARREGIAVRGYVSCVVGCPYEGFIAPDSVSEVADQLFDMGCYEVSLGDTIGVGAPAKVLTMLESVARRVPTPSLAGHFHDTYGMAVANVHASVVFGVRVFDASIGGLGGCPYATGASGNVATEDLVYLMDELGMKTGISLAKLIEVSAWISKILGRPPGSKVTRAMLAKRGTIAC